MTSKYRGDEDSQVTQYSQWVRRLPYPLNSRNFDAQNIDFVWHNYKERWFILIEEKRFNARQSFAQRQTHSVIDQMLREAQKNGVLIDDLKGNAVRYEYRGYYLVVFEKACPQTSQWVDINGVRYSGPEIIMKRLHRTGRLE